ncbi:MAG: nucleotidyltransferase domain-containing protein [Chloroflexi bacterium]|nr:MAG: nucleotidyltransferase domain-containing protein [Chloroflexota bacterium]
MENQRAKQLSQTLSAVLDTLIHQYQPEKIILFGSAAAGAPASWSDLDLVIIKNTPLPFLQRSKEVALLCRAPVGVDFLVYTPDEFETMMAENNVFIVEEVLGKGKVLYEHPAAKMATARH